MEEKLWFNKNIEEVKEELNTNIDTGLSGEEAQKRIEEYGYNELKEQNKTTVFQKFLNQFKDFMIIVLLIAAVISGVLSFMEDEGLVDSIIILAIVILNAIIGVVQECKAEASLEALKKMSGYVAKVVRNGKTETIPTKELVPGDIVLLDTGDVVPADIRLVESFSLKSQEASLTGESLPVEKDVDTIENKETSIGDRTNMVFSSSMISYGRGKGIVTQTGMNTQVGKIANMLENADSGLTPLQKKLEVLGKTLGIAAIAICVVIFIVGIAYGKEPFHMFMSAVSLAVAAIPEGLPAIATIALSIGVTRMVKRNAIVRKLPSVETLGSATVICSDKTGTLTQNKMTVVKLYYNNNTYDIESVIKNEEYKNILKTGLLCNESKIVGEDNDKKIVGDPTETVLVELAQRDNIEKQEYDQRYIRIGEVPFDSDRKLMSTINVEDGKNIVHTKGAVDGLLKVCKFIQIDNNIIELSQEMRETIIFNNEEMAKQALRMLGFAYKQIDNLPDVVNNETIENDLIFVGMVGMIDPPRPEAKEAVAKC